MIWVNNVPINKGFTPCIAGLVNSISFDTELAPCNASLWQSLFWLLVRRVVVISIFLFILLRSASFCFELSSGFRLWSQYHPFVMKSIRQKIGFFIFSFSTLETSAECLHFNFLSHCRAQNDLHSSKLNIDKILSRNIDEGFFTSQKSRHVISWDDDARFMLAVNNKWQINRSIRVGRHKIHPSYKFAFIFSSLL